MAVRAPLNAICQLAQLRKFARLLQITKAARIAHATTAATSQAIATVYRGPKQQRSAR